MKLAVLSTALLSLISVSAAAGSFIPPEQAFFIDVQKDKTGYVLVADVTPGFALYREKLTIKAGASTLSPSAIPHGRVVDEPGIGRTELLTGTVRIPVKAIDLQKARALSVSYQGCKLDDYCYPPQRVTLPVPAR